MNEDRSIEEEAKHLRSQNAFLQALVAQNLEQHEVIELEPSEDHEEKLLEVLSSLDEWREQLDSTRRFYDNLLREDTAKLKVEEDHVSELANSFQRLKHTTAAAAFYIGTDKLLPSKTLLQFEAEDQYRDKELEKARLKNISMRHHVQSLEMQVQEKENMKDGLHLIDFEQLKIENQTFSEKVEDRNEELARLRRKITKTIHVLAHLKEKMQFVQRKNLALQGKLSQTDDALIQQRDKLGRAKKDRDNYRNENAKLRQASGLIASADLLSDLECVQQKVLELQEQFASLRAEHSTQIAALKKLQATSQRTTDTSRKTYT